MQIIYVKTTVHALPEALRTSVSRVVNDTTPEATLKKIRRTAAKRGIDATYELSTEAEYRASRAAP
jgi:hypothetical protein